MARQFYLLLLLLALAGCEAKPAAKQPVVTTGGSSTQTDEGDTSESNDPPVKPTPKPDPMKTTAQTFVPAEDKELAALKDVPVEELIAKLGDAKQRDLASRALVSRDKEAVDPLVKALDSEDAQVRAAAAFALGQLGKDAADAKERLKKMSQDDRDEIARDAATFALDALEPPAKPE
jgi:hypothetical protein